MYNPALSGWSGKCQYEVDSKMDTDTTGIITKYLKNTKEKTMGAITSL